MSPWQTYRGHAAQIAMFRRAAQRERLAQAYLLVGPAGVGKRTFARHVAQCLFCERFAEAELDACGECGPCRQMRAGSHPDFFAIGCPEGKRELPLRLMVGEDDRRGREGLCHDLSLRPLSGRGRIAIVDDAQTMNDEAANAFLKTLEEPPPGSLIFLIAPQPDGLLPTIRSRCQQVRFGPLPQADIADLLVTHAIVPDAQTAAVAASFSEGSLETAARLADPTLADLRRAVTEELSRTPFDPGGAAARLIKAVEPAGDAAAQREATVWLARFAAGHFQQAMHAALRRETADPTPTVERMADLADRAADIEGQLALYTSAGLCIEAFAYDIAGGLRGA